jgi:hypothetical protein
MQVVNTLLGVFWLRGVSWGPGSVYQQMLTASSPAMSAFFASSFAISRILAVVGWMVSRMALCVIPVQPGC